jgi:two-component system, cell cycle response regulator CpdR
VSRLVLVVDDEPIILELTTSMLEELGCEVMADTPAEALRLLMTHARIEILITDVQMPGMDGYTLARKARRLRHDLKVIVVSGRAVSQDNLPLVRKPFNRDDLARVMEQTTGLC